MSFAAGYQGAGTVRLVKSVDGLRVGGLIDAGNITSLVLSAPPEVGERISRRKDSRGQALDTVSKPTTQKVKWIGDGFFKKAWEIVMGGLATDFSGASITDEPATARVLDEWVPFGDQQVFPGHALSALTDSTGTTTYVLNTDYEYRQVDGAIKYMSTGAINLNDDLLGDLTAPTSGYSVGLNTNPQTKVMMLVDGINEFNGKDTFLTLYQVTNVSTGSTDLLAGEQQKFEFEGTCEVPSWTNVPGMWYYKD